MGSPQPRAPAHLTPAMWELVISVDPSLDTEPDPASPCPKDLAPVVVRVDRPELLVGRHDDRRDVHPDLPVVDPGASRRHAKFVVQVDGTVALVDLASTNGTHLNGVEVAAGSRTTLKADDAITLGRWTRIVLRGCP